MGRGPGRKVTRGGLLSCGDERDVSGTGHLVSRLPWSEPQGTWGPAQTGLVLGFSSKGHTWAWGPLGHRALGESRTLKQQAFLPGRGSCWRVPGVWAIWDAQGSRPSSFSQWN